MPAEKPLFCSKIPADERMNKEHCVVMISLSFSDSLVDDSSSPSHFSSLHLLMAARHIGSFVTFGRGGGGDLKAVFSARQEEVAWLSPMCLLAGVCLMMNSSAKRKSNQ